MCSSSCGMPLSIVSSRNGSTRRCARSTSSSGLWPSTLTRSDGALVAERTPGGPLLAFGSTRDRKDGEIYLVGLADRGGVERVTFGQGEAPAFSPDGRSLAFSSSRGKGAGWPDGTVALVLEPHGK